MRKDLYSLVSGNITHNTSLNPKNHTKWYNVNKIERTEEVSAYIELMQLRKVALRQGDKKKAKEYMAEAQKLREKGEVSSKDYLGSAYS